MLPARLMRQQAAFCSLLFVRGVNTHCRLKFAYVCHSSSTVSSSRSCQVWASSFSSTGRFPCASASIGIASKDFSQRIPMWNSSAVAFKKVPTNDDLSNWDDEDDNDEKNTFEQGSGSGKGRSSGGSGDGSSGSGDGDSEGGPEDEENFFWRLIAMYKRSIARRPVLTKATSTFIIGLAGDYCAQRIANFGNGEFMLDFRRFASVGAWSFCFMGPVLHYWYGVLDYLFVGKYSVVFKVLSDQIFFAPLFNGSFIAGVGALEGDSFRTVRDSLSRQLWPSMQANWMLWPAAQVINFAVIPKQWQIIYVNFVGFAWNIILTYIAHAGKASHESAHGA